jgi:hypothetical protein
VANPPAPTSREHVTDGSMLPVAVALAIMVVWGGTPMFSKLAAAEIDPLF